MPFNHLIHCMEQVLCFYPVYIESWHSKALVRVIEETKQHVYQLKSMNCNRDDPRGLKKKRLLSICISEISALSSQLRTRALNILSVLLLPLSIH